MTWQIDLAITRSALIAPTPKVPNTHQLLYPHTHSASQPKPGAATRIASAQTLENQIESLGESQRNSASAVEQELNSTVNWLTETARLKPNALVYAKRKEIGGKNGTLKSTAIVLYTKSRPGNFISKWIDSTFYSDDKALAKDVLMQFESYFRASGQAQSSTDAQASLPNQQQEKSDNLSVDAFKNRLKQCAIAVTESKQAAMQQAVSKQVALESALFDPFSIAGSYLHMMIAGNDLCLLEKFITSTSDQTNATLNALIKDHGFPEHGCSAFGDFIKSIESGTANKNLNRQHVLDYSKAWASKYNDADTELKNLIAADPTLKLWNGIALVVAERDRYFDIDLDTSGAGVKISSTDDMKIFMENNYFISPKKLDLIEGKLVELGASAAAVLNESREIAEIGIAQITRGTDMAKQCVGKAFNRVLIAGEKYFAPLDNMRSNEIKICDLRKLPRDKQEAEKPFPQNLLDAATSTEQFFGSVLEGAKKIADTKIDEAVSAVAPILQATVSAMNFVAPSEKGQKDNAEDELITKNKPQQTAAPLQTVEAPKNDVFEDYATPLKKRKKQANSRAPEKSRNSPDIQRQISTSDQPEIKNVDRFYTPAVITPTLRTALTPITLQPPQDEKFKLPRIDVHVGIQVTDWENGDMFVMTISSPALADGTIAQEIFDFTFSAFDRSYNLHQSNSEKNESRKSRPLFPETEMDEKEKIENQVVHIIETYHGAISRAAETGTKKLVVTPCYSEHLSKEDRRISAEQMLSALHHGLTDHPEMQVTLIARCEEEMQELNAASSDLARRR